MPDMDIMTADMRTHSGAAATLSQELKGPAAVIRPGPDKSLDRIANPLRTSE